MDDLTSAPSPYADRGDNVQHLARQAEVIFIKKVRRKILPGETGESPTVDFENKYHEFINNGILKQNSELGLRDAYVTGEPIYDYWQVTTSSVGASTIVTGGTTNLSNVSGTEAMIPNADVSEIHIQQTVRGMSTATVTLRSPLNKYVFQNNPVYAGQAIFESDDLVYVNLPGLDGNLYRRFTGLATTIDINTIATGETFINSLTINCDDMLKLLKQTRIAARTSMTVREAQHSFSPLTISYANQLPHEVLTQLFARAYCDFTTLPAYLTELERIRGLDPKTGADEEEVLLQRMSKLPAANASGSSSITPILDASSFIVRTGTIQTNAAFLNSGASDPGGTATGESSKSTRQIIPVSLPRQIFGYTNARAPYALMSSIDKTVSGASPVPDAKNFPADTLVFLIEGTAQPAWSISFASASVTQLLISEWKSAFDVAMGVAQEIEFELFTTPEGIVRFRPFNSTLPADVSPPKYSKDLSPSVYPRVGYEYWLQPQFIKNSTLSNTDKGVFTIAYVLGLYQMSNLNGAQLQYLRPGIAVDSRRFAKLGARVAPQKQKLGLVTEIACQAYAVPYLARLNAESRSGTLDYVGDARIQAGNPVYIPSSNQIYYLESLTDTFIAGKSYTMSMHLTYGRVPFSLTNEKATTLVKSTSDVSAAQKLQTYYTFVPTLNRLQQNGTLTDEQVYQGGLGTSGSSEVKRYLKYGPPTLTAVSSPTQVEASASEEAAASQSLGTNTILTTVGDGSLVFNGYVWEDIPIMTYEDISTDTLISGPAISLAKLLSDQRTQSRVFFQQVQAVMRKNPTYTPEKAMQEAIKVGVAETTSTTAVA
jgi:hypothetical protein